MINQRILLKVRMVQFVHYPICIISDLILNSDVSSRLFIFSSNPAL